jgi:hypothetical protein
MGKPTADPSLTKLMKLCSQWLADRKSIATIARRSNSYLRRRWRDLSLAEKHRRAFQHADAAGGFMISLNLSAEIERKARVHSDPIGYLKNRVNNAVRTNGHRGLQFLLIFEFNKKGRLHAHGVVITENEPIDEIKQVFRMAGGKLPTLQRPTQLRLIAIFSGEGALRYIQKSRNRTDGLLSGRRSAFMSRSLALSTTDFHESNRPKKRSRAA